MPLSQEIMGSSPLKSTSTCFSICVLETHEREKVISATTRKRYKSEPFFPDLSSVTLSVSAVDSTVFVFTEGLSEMTCWVLVLTGPRIVALHEASGMRPCLGWLRLNPEERNFSLSFSNSPFSPVSQLYMFNELESFLLVSLSSPHSNFSTPSLSLHARTRFFFFFLLHPMFPLLAITPLQKGLRKRTFFVVSETHLLPQCSPVMVLTFDALYCTPSKKVRKTKCDISWSNNEVNERTAPKYGFADLCTCKNYHQFRVSCVLI